MTMMDIARRVPVNTTELSACGLSKETMEKYGAFIIVNILSFIQEHNLQKYISDKNDAITEIAITRTAVPAQNTANVFANGFFTLVDPTKEMPPAAVLQSRVMKGLCVVCQQQCYTLSDTGSLTPITIEGHVLRGLCLLCFNENDPVIILQEDDVELVRNTTHPGNIKLRAHITKLLPEYRDIQKITANRHDNRKDALISSVIDSVLSAGGRFLTLVDHTGPDKKYCLAPDAFVRKNVWRKFVRNKEKSAPNKKKTAAKRKEPPSKSTSTRTQLPRKSKGTKLSVFVGGEKINEGKK